VEFFQNFTAINKFIRKRGAIASLEEYLVHFQEDDLASYWSFWKEVVAYKSISNPVYRTGKAYLMCQKYLNADALVTLPLIIQKQKETACALIVGTVEAVEEAQDDSVFGVPREIFDDIFGEVEVILAGTLFVAYTNSEIYAQFCKGEKKVKDVDLSKTISV